MNKRLERIFYVFNEKIIKQTMNLLFSHDYDNKNIQKKSHK
jgi:hypothetical protein